MPPQDTGSARIYWLSGKAQLCIHSGSMPKSHVKKRQRSMGDNKTQLDIRI